MTKQSIAVIYRPGQGWQQGTTFYEQPGIMEHANFLKGQFDNGTLKAGGPFLDDTGGLSIFETDDVEALRNVINHDPTIASGLMTFEFHPVAFPFER